MLESGLMKYRGVQYPFKISVFPFSKNQTELILTFGNRKLGFYDSVLYKMNHRFLNGFYTVHVSQNSFV